MLVGKLESVTSSGYIVGWSYDNEALLQPLIVSVQAGSDEVAMGIANNYRHDLAEAGRGTGWCGFRLRLSEAIDQHSQGGVSLWSLTNRIEICRADHLPLVDDHEPALLTLDDVVSSDPTMVHSIDQLRGCGQVFAGFIESDGVAAFVRAAYFYILDRPADAASLDKYVRSIEDNTIAPYDLLRMLYESEEFRSMPGILPSPPEPCFLFRKSR